MCVYIIELLITDNKFTVTNMIQKKYVAKSFIYVYGSLFYELTETESAKRVSFKHYFIYM